MTSITRSLCFPPSSIRPINFPNVRNDYSDSYTAVLTHTLSWSSLTFRSESLPLITSVVLNTVFTLTDPNLGLWYMNGPYTGTRSIYWNQRSSQFYSYYYHIKRLNSPHLLNYEYFENHTPYTVYCIFTNIIIVLVLLVIINILGQDTLRGEK